MQSALPEEVDRLTGAERDSLTRPVLEEEVREAIQKGRDRSAPGPDRLGYSFYKTFEAHLTAPLVTLFNRVLSREEYMSQEYYGAVLTFIFKGGDPTLVTNWRPIAVTNADYRILARILNSRLAKVADKLVHGCQTSAVPRRHMVNSLILLREVFEEVRLGRWDGVLLQLDQAKDFDRVDRTFLDHVLT